MASASVPGISKEKYEQLYKIYHDINNPAAYSGVSKLYNAVKHIPNITKSDVKSFLKNMDGFTLHGPITRRFIRRPYKVSHPGHILGADLADFSNIKKYNKGFRYVLFLIDMFSRKLDVFPIKDKQNSTIANVLDDFFKNYTKHRYSFFFSDEGREFIGASVNKLLKSYDIKQYHSYSRKIKNGIAERVIKTVKSILYRYFTQNDTLNYLDIIHKIVNTYNITAHSGLCGLTPQYVDDMRDLSQIKSHEIDQMRQKLKNYPRSQYIYTKTGQNSTSRHLDINEGTYVRLLSEKSDQAFSKGYTPQFTGEIFKVSKIDNSSKPTVFYLQDLLGESIEGMVYRYELKPTVLPQKFPIEKIIRTKYDKNLRKKLFLVKFKYYPEKFNSWVDKIDSV